MNQTCKRMEQNAMLSRTTLPFSGIQKQVITGKVKKKKKKKKKNGFDKWQIWQMINKYSSLPGENWGEIRIGQQIKLCEW